MEEALASSQSASHAVCSHSLQNAYSVTGNSHAVMRSASTHFCWLTMASGNFDGNNGAFAGVKVSPHSDGFWRLTGENPSAKGEGRCSPLSCFRGDGIDDVVWVSSQFSALAWSTGGCDTFDTNAWWGDAASLVQSWPGPGRTEGSGEIVAAIISSSAWSPSKIKATDCYFGDPYGVIRAIGNSLFVGTPSGGKLARYVGAPFSVQGNYTLNLGVYTDEAICFLTRISGKYRGYGEEVKLYPVLQSSTGRYLYYARAKQGGAGASVRGEGRCYYFHQWDL